MAKSKNSYLCHVTKIVSISMNWQDKNVLSYIRSIFLTNFRHKTIKTGKYVKELSLSFS